MAKKEIVKKIIEEVKNFEKLQEELSDYGAADSEASHTFEWLLARAALNRECPEIPKTGEDWRLYVSSKGCESAAKKLFDAAEKVVKLVRSTTMDDLFDVRRYILFYSGFCDTFELALESQKEIILLWKDADDRYTSNVMRSMYSQSPLYGDDGEETFKKDFPE